MSILNLSRIGRRLAPLAALIAPLALAACSSSGYQSDYVSPIAATPAPAPTMPVVPGVAPTHGRMPLLPPVPEKGADAGLPPVTVATLLPPPVR